MRKRVIFVGLWLLSLACAGQAGQTVHYWYYTDSATQDPVPVLAKAFEQSNPGISIRAERIAKDVYEDKIHTAVIGGNAPDAALLTLAAMPPLLELDALEPLDARIAAWQGKNDIVDDIWRKLPADDTKTYLLPLRFNVGILYVRRDLFEQYHIPYPTTMGEFLSAAQKLTLDVTNKSTPDIYGFGFPAGNGGHESWGVIVMPNARDVAPWELEDPWVNEANQFVIDLYTVHHVVPSSARKDSIGDSVDAFCSGKTAMFVHNYSVAETLENALADNQFTAIPVPHCGKNGEAWTSLHDEENAIFAASEVKDAAWEWITFLATDENNQRMVEASGWLPVTKSGLDALPARRLPLVEATLDSLPFAFTLPSLPQTERFVESVWPALMQQALSGEIDSRTMLQAIDQLFNE